MTKAEVELRIGDVLLKLVDLRKAIDEVGAEAAALVGEQADMLGCFASNTLHGSSALLHDMLALVRAKAKKKGARAR